jgi:hypothetical protein
MMRSWGCDFESHQPSDWRRSSTRVLDPNRRTNAQGVQFSKKLPSLHASNQVPAPDQKVPSFQPGAIPAGPALARVKPGPSNRPFRHGKKVRSEVVSGDPGIAKRRKPVCLTTLSDGNVSG